ncbi:hypothetical protein [Mycobacteroides abscessus]|uniref:hypothetical protein n=1 Tax=Mycobacteroides abscessus TaxID=36809 RepID=UPI00094355D1|nr:hypothetical protein [Mycobacteroides abscessus]MBN7324377.1 hypothetical protein [Mycobacteroides abscessus subsp. massiliense]MBN7428765.1 hypothetical protein [Mycobacteroides abscessus subsp. massiliense]
MMYTQPLRQAEYEQLIAVRYNHPGRAGWALIDDEEHVRGWHPVERTDPHWITAEAALQAFVPDAARRRFVLLWGWHVCEDTDGRHLPEFLRRGRGEQTGPGPETDQLTISLLDLEDDHPPLNPGEQQP